jgi:cell division protein FtsL
MTSPVRAPRPTPRRAPQPAPAPRRPHLRVVPPPARPKVGQAVRRRRTGAVLGVAMVVVFGSLLASAMFHGMLVSGQSDLDRIDAQIQEERTALAQEKLELANLQSPARIAEEAARLGMVPSEQQHWVTPGSTDDPIVTGSADDPEADADADGDTGTGTGTDTGTDDGSTGSPEELASGGTGGAAQ